ncbi:MAG: nicotinate-nucleotide--dimethylbenzimidazole phosphoribosyltransferase [Christensenellales bacterium]|jgi:nicotinate-nucleotide--dimethylbenzimidazole phosphoribosyltransferase
MTDRNMAALCQQRWNNIAKPIGSLGQLENVVCRLAAIQGTLEVNIDRRVCLVMCADNGVLQEGVAQTPAFVTASQSVSIAKGKASVNAMARAVHCDVVAVDVGINTDVDAPELIRRKAGHGTGNIARGPAMTEAQLEQTLHTGMELVQEMKERGYQIICTGEMGIGNTTTTSAVTSVLLGIDPLTITGRGAGLSDEGLARKLDAINRAIAINQPDRENPMDVLRKVGGFDIVALTGIFLGGQRYRVPIVVDGVISAVSALAAVRIQPACADYLIASHLSREPSAALVLQELGLTPLLHADMALGEGTGAVALLPLLDVALAVYRQNSTYEQLDYLPPEMQKP